ncbi:hypothetical protein GNP64_02740 [Aliivibrio fischeri]|uniref:hypothetical protein n=1 Tax=Aliivibrio fischeri TaxID=668 RepID=UPI0012DAD9C6|nr:hypothetical protein [Aliivibrio fischeri]MUL04952.1 hypothetical protein [Aliivibrio fischeri]
MKKYNKTESEAIINHACQVAQQRGENQMDICNWLNLDAGHFSRCKTGKKILQQEKIEKLINKYGLPNFFQSGFYILSEYFSNIEELKTNFHIKNNKSKEFIIQGECIFSYKNENKTSLKLFITDKFNYYVVLKITYCLDTRYTTIRINSHSVVDDILQIFVLIDLEYDFDKLSLKRQLARKGGNIPGVILLD